MIRWFGIVAGVINRTTKMLDLYGMYFENDKQAAEFEMVQ